MKALRETMALDALVAMTLRGAMQGDVTTVEVEAHVKDPNLTQEQEEAFNQWKKQSLARILSGVSEPLAVATPVEDAEFAAMNRDNQDDKHDAKTEEELKRLRKELLGEEEET